MNFRLFDACKKTAPDLLFNGISEYEAKEKIPENVNITSVNILGLNNVWRAFVPSSYAFMNKEIPFYFPFGNVPGFMPESTQVISLIRDVLPLDLLQDEETLKKYKRNIQTDINRSDLIFVLSENIKKRLMQEFLFMSEPVVLNFASLIPDEYIDLPMARNNEKYFFVDVENVSPAGLSDLLKVFIYSQMKDKKSTKLYLSGNLKLATTELLINMDVARKVGAIREYNNLSSEQRSVLLRGATAAILPAKNDILPFAQLDAMKCSCPVVTDMLPAITEVCGEAAIYADITDGESFKMLLLRLEQDESFRNEHIYRGLAQEKVFSWSGAARTFTENLTNLFREI